jgi:hypothetical protein
MENKEKPDYKGLNLEAYPSGRWPLKSSREEVRELSLCITALVSKAIQVNGLLGEPELMWIHDAARWIYQHPSKTQLLKLRQARALINNCHRRFL